MSINGKSKELVSLRPTGQALDMAIFEREIRRVFTKWREDGHQNEDTVPAMLRAIETYEAATR